MTAHAFRPDAHSCPVSPDSSDDLTRPKSCGRDVPVSTTPSPAGPPVRACPLPGLSVRPLPRLSGRPMLCARAKSSPLVRCPRLDPARDRADEAGGGRLARNLRARESGGSARDGQYDGDRGVPTRRKKVGWPVRCAIKVEIEHEVGDQDGGFTLARRELRASAACTLATRQTGAVVAAGNGRRHPGRTRKHLP